MQIDGKVVLITGASEGIGAACAAEFRRRGARLALTARNEGRLRAAATADDLVLPADLLDSRTPAELIRGVMARFGRLDVLINNAGAGLYEPAHQTSPELARRLFDLNFFAPLALVREAVPVMQQGSGTIVNVSSIAGLVTLPWFPLYSASKFALHSLSEGLRMELKPSGIHCISVCPGYVRTAFQSNVLSGEVPPALGGLRQRWAVTPEQCAEAIARGVERNARTVMTPRSGWLLVALSRLFPALVERRLSSVLRQHEPLDRNPSHA